MPVCGDGVVEPGESCDDGNLRPDDGCDVDCSSPDVAAEVQFAGVMPRGVAVAPDGWIVVTGSQTSPSIEPWVARVSDALVVEWAVVPDDPDVGDSVQTAAVASDGTIHVVGGDSYDDVAGIAFTAAFDTLGVLGDASNIVIGGWSRAQGIHVGADGSRWIGGEAGTYSAWIRHLDADGAVAWTWSQPDASAYTLGVDGAGNAIAAGTDYDGEGSVWRVTPAGQLDWALPQNTPWLELAVDPDGSIYVAGSREYGDDVELWVARLDPAGDEVWREDIANIVGAGSSDSAGGLALGIDGDLYFATQVPWEGSRLYRIDVADGTLTWSAIEVAWRWEDVAVLADGRPVVVGWDVAGPNATGIARVYAP
jgi:cysteine-rich repeat protein